MVAGGPVEKRVRRDNVPSRPPTAARTRNNRLFFSLIVQTAVVSFARSAIFALTFWMRIRVGIIWREKVTRLIHDQYLGSSLIFYKQLQIKEGGVQDPEERLARDIERTTDELGDLLYNIAYGAMMGVYSCVRLLYFVGWQHVAFSIGYSWFSVKCREYIVSGAKLGDMKGRFNLSNGKYKSAHLKLVQNCESIVAYGGVDREREQTMAAFDRPSRPGEAAWLCYLGHVALRHFWHRCDQDAGS